MEYLLQGRTVAVFASGFLLARASSERLVVAISLPCLLAACTSWQPQELNTLQGAILQEQPTRIQVRSPRTGAVEIDDPQVVGDVLFGLGHRVGFTNQELMRIPFSEVTEASFRAFDGARSAILGGGSVLILVVMIGMNSGSSP